MAIFSCELKIRLWELRGQQKQTEAVNLLQSWIDDEGEGEQQETGQYLIQALDDDR